MTANLPRTCQEIYAKARPPRRRSCSTVEYYEQKIIPPGDFANVAPRLRHGHMGAEQPDDPEFQIGDGCLLDQAVGDTYARLVGLGPVLDPGHVRVALNNIHRLNYVEDLGEWTNYMRTYAVHGERGHIVLSYPKGLPEHPMPYWCEVWTGLEYVYALGLVQQGEMATAEDVVTAARERFSGARRNPYDEAECGHHYARALSSWGLVVGLTGFDYDGRSGVMSFAEAKAPRVGFGPRAVRGGRWSSPRTPPAPAAPNWTSPTARCGWTGSSSGAQRCTPVSGRPRGRDQLRPGPGGLTTCPGYWPRSSGHRSADGV